MRLFIQIISTTQTRQSPRANSIEGFASEVHRSHSRIAEAVLARDPDTAERRMRRHLESVLDFIKPKKRRR
jgi:DNA-binding FadR family transcriptional regulator